MKIPAPPLPETLYVETTNRCNLSCRGCIQHRGSWETPRDMTLAEFGAILDGAPGVRRFVLHGIGEPLLNPALPAMIRRVKARGAEATFNTNGTLLDRGAREALAAAGLDELRVSLDAASPEGYAAVRGEGFDEVVGNIVAFTAELRAAGRAAPRISLWLLGTSENIAELPALVRLAASTGVPEVYLQRLVYFTDAEGYGLAQERHALAGGDARVAAIVAESLEEAGRLGVELHASGLQGPLESLRREGANEEPWRRCSRPWTVSYITAHGTVLPCCISPFSTADYEAIVLGNAFASSLSGVWHGPRYADFRRRHASGPPPVSCRGCNSLWSL